MTNKLIAILKSISSALPGNGKSKKKNESLVPVKHYTFLIKTKNEMKNINVIANDKTEAEHQIELQYPNYIIRFLWEYQRRTPADMEIGN